MSGNVNLPESQEAQWLIAAFYIQIRKPRGLVIPYHTLHFRI